MIYVFSGVQSICSIPGMLCRACGDLCAQINCKPIKECCDSAGKLCTHFMERPLSTYVVVAIVLGALALLNSGSTFIKLFGIAYIAFAFYFQHKVWAQIMEMRETFQEEDGAPGVLGGTLSKLQGNTPDPPVGSGRKLVVPRETVQAAFKKVFLEDVMVLGFFFIQLGVFVMDMMSGGAFGALFFWVAFGYSASWYCCSCCAGTVRIEKDDEYMLPEASAPPCE